MIRLFERGQLNFNGLFSQEVMTYESNIAYPLRFMIDTKVSRARRTWLSRAACRHELGRGPIGKVRCAAGLRQMVPLPVGDSASVRRRWMTH